MADGAGGVVEAVLEEPSLAVAFVVALALAVLCVWAWTVRKRRPRTARAVGWWGLAAYLLAAAMVLGLFRLADWGPEWFGWTAEEAPAEASP